MTTFRLGDHVEYVGGYDRWRGQRGFVQAIKGGMLTIMADYDGRTVRERPEDLILVSHPTPDDDPRYKIGDRVRYTGPGHRNGHTGTVTDWQADGRIVVVRADVDGELRFGIPSTALEKLQETDPADYPGYVTSSLTEWLEQNTVLSSDHLADVVAEVRHWIAYQLSR